MKPLVQRQADDIARSPVVHVRLGGEGDRRVVPPHLDAAPVRDGTIVAVWCPACDAEHVHGRPPDGVGGRRPHCETVDSPFWTTGYALIVRPELKRGDLVPPRSERRKSRRDNLGLLRHGWGDDWPEHLKGWDRWEVEP